MGERRLIDASNSIPKYIFGPINALLPEEKKRVRVPLTRPAEGHSPFAHPIVSSLLLVAETQFVAANLAADGLG